ncbi:MAG: FecR family protein, partial [Chromatiales bacterium]|nr:FecR family protein [Chromatiales bacterium]
MKSNLQLNIVALTLLLLLSSWLSIANASSKPIGKIILAVGEVIATAPTGEARKLKRRSKIYSGDTLTTKSGAQCQIRFSDKSLVALSGGSLFKVDEYKFDPNRGTKEKAIYSLLKGGMRTISGAIGKKNRADYQLNTPVATIGIRGTAFNIGLLSENGIQSLYGTVDSGAIVLENSQGDLKIQPGQNFQVPMNNPPQIILALPAAFPSSEESAKESSGEVKEPSGEAKESTDPSSEAVAPEDVATPEESLSIAELDSFIDDTTVEELPLDELLIVDDTTLLTDTTTEPLPTSDTNVLTSLGTLAPYGAAMGVSFVGMQPDGIAGGGGIFPNIPLNEVYIDTVDGVGNVPVLGTVYPIDAADPCNPCTFLAATGTLVTGDTGGNTIGVNWGRWDGSYTVMENGVAETPIGS